MLLLRILRDTIYTATGEQQEGFMPILSTCEELGNFFKDSARVIFLYDFWIDKPSTAAILSAIVLDLLRSSANVAAPVFLSKAVSSINNDIPDGAAAKAFMLGWAGAIAIERVLKAINDVITSGIQSRLSDTLVGNKLLKKLHTINFDDFKKEFRDKGISDRAIQRTEDMALILRKSINEFIPLFFNLVGSVIVLNLPSDLSPGLSRAASAVLWAYSAYNMTVSIGYSYYQRHVNMISEVKIRKFKNTLDEDIDNMETIRLYTRSPTRIESIKTLYNDFSQNIVWSDTKPALFKLFFIKAVLAAVILGAINLIAGDSVTKKNFDELVLIINFLVIFHFSTEAFGENISDTRKALRHLQELETEVADNPYSNETLSANYLPQPQVQVAATALPPAIQEPLLANPAVAGMGIPDLELPPKVVEFINVFYIEGEKQILNNVSFEIREGSSCALVGESGSGKSTIIKMLCGFCSPTSGQILFYGRNINEWEKDKLRETISVINQDAQLFKHLAKPQHCLQYNTLFGALSNLRLRDLQLNSEFTLGQEENEIFEEKVESYSLDSIKPDLSQPSGGERQRIGLARGIRVKKVLILDEPTSALDTHTENSIIENINEFITGNSGNIKALIVTGHRLKTIENCNLILVLINGEIVETVTVDTLAVDRAIYDGFKNAQESTPSFVYQP